MPLQYLFKIIVSGSYGNEPPTLFTQRASSADSNNNNLYSPRQAIAISVNKTKAKQKVAFFVVENSYLFSMLPKGRIRRNMKNQLRFNITDLNSILKRS